MHPYSELHEVADSVKDAIQRLTEQTIEAINAASTPQDINNALNGFEESIRRIEVK